MARIIALDLGAHSVKASVFDLSGRRLELQDRVSAPVPQDGSELPSHEARLAVLDDLLEEHTRWKAPGNDIGLAFPSQHAVLHRVTVPFTDPVQIEQTLPFTVEEVVPFDVDDMSLGWRAITREGGTTCMVALSPKARVGEVLEAMASRQVDPRVLVVDGDLLGQYGTDEPVAVLDVGHTHTIITVAHDGQALASRTVDVAGWHFTSAIAEALGCSWAEAEALKHEVPGVGGSGSHLPPEAARAVDAQMGLLLAGIRSALITMEDSLGLELVAVLVGGGGARLAPFTGYLRQDLGLEVLNLHAPGGEPIPGPYAISHALGQRLAGRNDRSVDLRVEAFAFRGGTDILKTVALGSVVVSGVFVLAALVVFVLQFSQIYSEQNEMDAHVRWDQRGADHRRDPCRCPRGLAYRRSL
jgi:Tfp pilus assembly PilM family ATPase